MPFASNLLGAATVALALVGGNAKVYESHAKCRVHALAHTDKKLGVQMAKAVQHASAYICDEGKVVDDGSNTAVAEAIASAYVNATTNVVLECYAKGKTSVKASGYAKAHAKGKAWLKAFAHAWSEAAVCLHSSPGDHSDTYGEFPKCHAVADAFIKVQQDVYLHATAESEEWINQSFDKHNEGEHLLKGDYETPKNDLMVALATATAKALAVAKKTATDEACFAGVQVTGETSLDDVVTNYAECTSAGVGFSLNYAKDAMAEAAKKASDIQCKGGRIEEEEAYDIVQDIATATAKVVAIGYSECKVTTGKGKVCAFQDVDISSIAHAAAYAFAEGWQSAKSAGCECKVSGDAAVKAFGGILVEAITSTWTEVCPRDGERNVRHFHDADFNWNWDKTTEHAKALATAIVHLADNTQPGNGQEKCIIDFEVEASVCQCVKPTHRDIRRGKKAVCKKSNDDTVLSCCEEGHECVKWGRRGVCMVPTALHYRRNKVLTPSCLEHDYEE